MRQPVKNWIHPDTDQAAELNIVDNLKIPPAIAAILAKRGLTTTEEINAFLNPTLQQLAPPALMKGMSQAVAILHKALIDKQTIAIFGDYDADGVTGSALLYLFLKEAGFKVTYYHPDRFSEGYGLNSTGLNTLKNRIQEEKGVPQGHFFQGVLVTVDCGISNYQEVAEAKEMGFSVIITDHHVPPEKLPKADAILNPLQAGCDFPFKELAGVGVAFYLTMGLRAHLVAKQYWTTQTAPNLKKYLDLVAIGTVADIVPLTGMNRILTKAGLEIIMTSKRPGLQKMIRNAKLDGNTAIYASDIAFQIGPRINAASRIEGRPDLSFTLLTTTSMEKASVIGDKLEKINSQRKELAESMSIEAIDLADNILASGKQSIIIYKPEWHPGITGLVASRLMNHYYKPVVILWQSEEGCIKGSCRSIPEVNIIEILRSCSEKLTSHGGHKAAAGLSMDAENLEKFIEEFEHATNKSIGKKELSPQILIDRQVEAVEVFNDKFALYFNKLQPFGKGNPEPIFSTIQPVQLENTRKVGRNSMKFNWPDNGEKYSGIGFGFADFISETENNKVDIAFTLQINSFRGRESLEMRLEDIHTNLTS